jgi:dihydrofolate reductase
MATRRIVTFNWVTADGYFAATDGNLDWVVPDAEQAKAASESISDFDTVLFGRRTYEIFERFWRLTVVDEFGAIPDPHNPGRRSREHGTVAVALKRMTKIVFSRSMKGATWENSRVFRELDPREIETMKAQSGKDLIIFGSGSIVSELTRHGLIDEYQFAVCPVLLGSGQSLVRGVSKWLPIDLLEAKRLSSGDIFLRYARSTRVLT